jgi:hypothetical protein
MYLALAGGVGGAKLAAGLADVLPADELVVIVNTGDDFEHLGLHISPDLDSVMYGLAGINNPRVGNLVSPRGPRSGDPHRAYASIACRTDPLDSDDGVVRGVGYTLHGGADE